MTAEADWLRDLLSLKETPRTGWFRAGVDRPESVADHTFAMTMLAWRIARETDGVDAGKVALLCLLHDFHEARLFDIPTPAKKHFPSGAVDAAEEAIQKAQWDGDDEALALLAEWREGKTAEAKLARAIDHLEFVLQAAHYLESGHARATAFLERSKSGPSMAHPATRPWAERILAGAGA